jgi:hypothetical protein
MSWSHSLLALCDGKSRTRIKTHIDESPVIKPHNMRISSQEFSSRYQQSQIIGRTGQPIGLSEFACISLTVDGKSPPVPSNEQQGAGEHGVVAACGPV